MGWNSSQGPSEYFSSFLTFICLILTHTLQYSPNEPIGHGTLTKIIKEAGKKMGFDVSGHAFRRLFITSLVNAPGVSTEESLASSRHNSVAAQRPYQQRNSDSEMAKFRALGLLGKEE